MRQKHFIPSGTAMQTGTHTTSQAGALGAGLRGLHVRRGHLPPSSPTVSSFLLDLKEGGELIHHRVDLSAGFTRSVMLG